MHHFINRHTGTKIALDTIPSPRAPEVLWVPNAGQAECGQPLESYKIGRGVPGRDGTTNPTASQLREHWSPCAPFDLHTEHEVHCSSCREIAADCREITADEAA